MVINAKVRLAEPSEKERQAVRKRADELYAEVTSAVSGKSCRPKKAAPKPPKKPARRRPIAGSEPK
jgi:hypothetical protein